MFISVTNDTQNYWCVFRHLRVINNHARETWDNKIENFHLILRFSSFFSSIICCQTNNRQCWINHRLSVLIACSSSLISQFTICFTSTYQCYLTYQGRVEYATILQNIEKTCPIIKIIEEVIEKNIAHIVLFSQSELFFQLFPQSIWY